MLLESDEPVELPPADVEESAVIVQFDKDKPFAPELLETLREGTLAELVPVMMDDSTFAIHTRTRTFWVKIWHASDELTKIERVQVISCMPSTRGVQVIANGLERLDEEDYEDEDEDYEDADQDLDDETHAADEENESSHELKNSNEAIHDASTDAKRETN